MLDEARPARGQADAEEPGDAGGDREAAIRAGGWTPEADSAHAGAKNIVLFSDGTGNSSAKLFKTNVWRMYEAVDLGPSASEGREQIAYYDDGVGTSGFKPLAILGGIFGVGLKRNVLDIYRYACRNYARGPEQRPGEKANGRGDLIYGFGFSRGAFTMRVAIALIADQGLVPYTNERELKHRAAAAYRAFCDNGRLRYPFSPMRLVRALTRVIGWLWRAIRRAPSYDSSNNYRPTIRFIGVWDTVAAYGGPIAEITRAIDNWIHPLSMPNYELSPKVQRARHALALDDERDSFHPLLWDEVAEAELIRKREAGLESLPPWVDEERLEQVWFAGMHADVGGGYPDESLSFVSLLWMIEEANKAELRTLKVITDRYRALASSFGPIHNSRSGVGAYYRYQPRRVAAWLDGQVDGTDSGERAGGAPEGGARSGTDRQDLVLKTLSLRDPAIKEGNRPKGLLRTARMHESVIARIAEGTDGYAPFVLPPEFRIVPPGEKGEKQPQADSEGGKPADGKPVEIPLISQGVRGRLNPDATHSIAEALEPVWSRVWLRRATYFLTLGMTLALLAMPLWIERAPEPPILTDGRTWIGGVIRLLALLLPDFLGDVIEVYANNSFYFLLLLGLIVALTVITSRVEVRLRDRTRAIWKTVLANDGSAEARKLMQPPASPLRAARNSFLYQRGVQVFKWHILPNIFGLLLLLLIAWVAVGLYTQIRLPALERGTRLCPGNTNAAELETAPLYFSARKTCNPVGAVVQEGQRYVVTFDVMEDWYDGGMATSPTGLTAADMGLPGYFGVPFRRVVSANYLQPMLEIRPLPGSRRILQNVYIHPLELKREGDSGTLYRGEFVARRTGELYLFANDAVLPFTSPVMGIYNLDYFYKKAGGQTKKEKGNRGTACVAIARSDRSGDYSVTDAAPTCVKAAALAASRRQ